MGSIGVSGFRAWALAGASAAAIVSPAWAQDGRQQFNLPAQPLAAALEAFGAQSGTDVIFDGALAAGRTSRPVEGNYTPEEALRRLLDGTGLIIRRANAGTFLVEPSRPQAGAAAPDAASEPAQVADIVVTGSHIQGAPTTAPIHIVSREDIDRSGYSQIGDIVRSLPENFNGGQNPGVLAGATSGSQASQNIFNASTVNLRGLGTDATLVLLNGRRLPGDAYFGAPDISGIPLAAVRRIEIVTDGASALYGSDAVAGVANFILRKDYDGLELSARYGGATQGGGEEQTYGVLAGRAWDSGHVLANVEYSEQDAILAGQRDFTSGARPTDALLRAFNRRSAFLSAGQELTPSVALDIDVMGSHQESDRQVTSGSTTYIQDAESDSYLVSTGLKFDLPGEWTSGVDGSYSESSNIRANRFVASTTSEEWNNASRSIEANASGPVLNMPGGRLMAAIGGGYRNEDYSYTGATIADDGSRDVRYLFAELSVPLVEPSNTRVGLQELEISLAGRVEDYSDFGSTTNPKVGLRYVPFNGLTARATWGKSFKAPLFNQTVPAQTVFYYPGSIVGASEPGGVLIAFGGNPDLGPERSSSWTGGIDWSPVQRPSLIVSATYFDIDYTDRVVQPISSPVGALLNPIYEPFITLAPTPAEQAAAIAAATDFFNYTGGPYDPAQTLALIDDRWVNATSQKVNGVDISVRDTFVTAVGDVSAFLNMSWLEITQKVIPTVGDTTLTGTLFNPPELRARGGLSWSNQAFSATGIVNYISSETDTGVMPRAEIDAWTTIDLNFAYRGAEGTPLAGAELALSITNAFDEDPPFARGAAVSNPGIFFDSTNSSVVGRFVALTLRKRF